ncbi:MAG: hypothetical protein M1828_003769 [Chrysothrix sp. TS-e1954]|nr:MAG: hypothetical protein M1828_003769 [Chrysothrix sp. TS-e1954]
MALRPGLQTNNLPAVNEDSATASPARGKETRINLLQKLRPPEFVHKWVFWYEKPPSSRKDGTSTDDNNNTRPTSSSSAASPEPTATDHKNGAPTSKDPTASYSTRLSPLSEISDVKEFWSVFNNFSFSTLPVRSSAHLFHSTVQPLWEDARNARGGAWDIRVPKQQASHFWRSLCLLAIGEGLQAAVANERERATFRDDICGVSFRPKWNQTLIEIWNRDAGHDKGIMEVKRIVVEAWDEEGLKAIEWRYRRHSEREGFNEEIVAGSGRTEVEAAKADAEEQAKALKDAKRKSSAVNARVAAVGQNVEQMQKNLEAVQLSEQENGSKLGRGVITEERIVEEEEERQDG